MDWKLLEELSALFGPSGYEDEVKDFLISRLKGFAYEEDHFGNLIFHREGEKKGRRIAVVSHIDEIGFIVHYKGPGTFVKLTPIGGWDKRIPISTRVKIKTDSGYVFGVFASIPPHLKRNGSISEDVDITDMWVDVGENYDRVNVGDPAVIDCCFFRISENQFMGKAFDDRVGSFINYHLIRNSSPLYETHFIFSLQEEAGLRGATALSMERRYDFVIVLECTSADSPYLPEDKQSSFLGKGPVITIADRSVIVKQRIWKAIAGRAESLNIPYQFKRPLIGGTDAGAIYRTSPNVAVVSVPARYIHTPLQIVDRRDIENTYKLVKSLVEEPII